MRGIRLYAMPVRVPYCPSMGTDVRGWVRFGGLFHQKTWVKSRLSLAVLRDFTPAHSALDRPRGQQGRMMTGGWRWSRRSPDPYYLLSPMPGPPRLYTPGPDHINLSAHLLDPNLEVPGVGLNEKARTRPAYNGPGRPFILCTKVPHVLEESSPGPPPAGFRARKIAEMGSWPNHSFAAPVSKPRSPKEVTLMG